MAVHVFLKAGLQCFEEVVTLFFERVAVVIDFRSYTISLPTMETTVLTSNACNGGFHQDGFFPGQVNPRN